MAETVGAVAAAAGIPASLQSCVDFVRKAITWGEQLSEVQRDYEDLRLDLSGLLFELEHLSHMCHFSVHSRTGYERISRQVSRMTEDLKIIENMMQKKRHKVFPSVTNDKIMKVQRRVKDLIHVVRSLREDAENERLRARRKGRDYFLVGGNNARRDGPNIVLNFDARKENGERRTFEGQLLDALLATNSSKTVTACARGYGGVGKTCALRGVAHHPEVEKRFWGGVYYGTLGQDVRKGQLREMIVEMVKSSGGMKRATEISAKNDFEEFIISAGQWFEPFPCLFLIDDIWFSDGSDVRDFELVRNLARHPLSRVAFTTRDSTLGADRKILFEHRDRGGEDSRQILLKTAGFEAEPKLPNAANAFEELLQIGNGLPLKLALIGGGVRQVVDLYSMSNPENAWTEYHENGGKELANEKDVLMRSLSFIDKDNPDGVHHRHFKSLSVLRYAQSVNIGVASRIWDMSEAESRVETELLGRYHIVRLVASFTDDSQGGEITVSLHDEMLTIAREEAVRDDYFIMSARRVVYSYLRNPQGATTAAVSVSGALEHPVSDTRLGLNARGMVCAVGASLEEANLNVGTSDLVGAVSSHAKRWPMVEVRGYFYENLCWLLSSGKLYYLLKWLISEPQWLIRQLFALGVGQVQSDLDIVSQSFAGDSDAPDVNKFKRCIELMKLTVIACKVDFITSKWCGMPWFQLHGRLSHFAEQSDWVREYIGKIERLAPRPWYKPSVGCLLPASMSLLDTVSLGSGPKCVALVENVVSCCYQDGSGDIILQKNEMSRTAGCDRAVLCKCAPYSLRNAAVSGDARTLVLCLKSGDILLRNLDLEAQPRVLQTETLDTPPNQAFARTIKNVVKRVKKFIQKRKHRDQKFKAKYSLRVVGKHKDVICLALNQSGESIASGSKDGTVQVWKVRDGVWESTMLKGHTDWVRCVSVSADGTQIMSGSDDKTVRVWKMKDRAWVSTALEGHTDMVSCVSVSRDGTQIVSGSHDKTVRVWRLRDGEWESTALEGHMNWVKCISVCSDGTQIVSGSYDETVRVWKMRDGVWESATLEGHTRPVECVSVSSDGVQIASGSYDNTMRVWKMRDRMWKSTALEGHTEMVSCVSVSRDGIQVVSGSYDKTVRVWKMRDGEWESTALEGHTSTVECVSMSADGSQIVSGSCDKTVRVWKMRDGVWESTALKGHEDMVRCVSVSTDGTRIASQSSGGDVSTWNLLNEEWVRHAREPCAFAKRLSVSFDFDSGRKWGLNQISLAIASKGTHHAHRSYFFRVSHYPYFVRIDEIS